MPPTRDATTGRPRQNASTSTRPIPSLRDGSTSTVAASSARATPSVGSASVHVVRSGRSATSRSTTSRRAPRPTRCSVAAGHLRGDGPPGLGQLVDPLVVLEHTDEQRSRRRGQGHGRAEERLQVHERGEDGGRLDTVRADERRRVVGDRPHRIGPAQRGDRDAIGDRVEQPARRRPVQPGGRPPVAVDVEDHRRVQARQRAAEQDEPRLVRTLDEDGVGPRPAQLAAGAERQAEEVEGAVEAARPVRPRELEDAVASRGAVDAARQHAQVEPLEEHVELRLQALAERQPVPRPADQQQPPLPAHPAASWSSASSRVYTGSGSNRSDRARRGRPQPFPQALVREEASDRGRERLRVAGRHEQAVLAVRDDLGDSADAGRDHGRADREPLDHGVREVLPPGREHLGVGGGEQLEDGLPRLRAQEAHAVPEAELGDEGVQPSAVRPVAGDHEGDTLAGLDARAAGRPATSGRTAGPRTRASAPRSRGAGAARRARRPRALRSGSAARRSGLRGRAATRRRCARATRSGIT